MKNLFIPIMKVDQAQRLVYGVAAVEEVDKSGEIFDYETSKPLFEAWSADAQKWSQGKSYGNVRAMHGKVAAGRLDQIAFDDTNKCIEVCAKIVDENEWQKVEDGVYTGFSIGGKYDKRWKDGEYTRYTAAPSEVSIVDNPCQPSARFTMTKADGSSEERRFSSVEEEGPMATNEQVAELARTLAKAEGAEDKWPSFVEKARAQLDGDAKAKADATPSSQPTDDSEGQNAEGEARNADGTPKKKTEAPPKHGKREGTTAGDETHGDSREAVDNSKVGNEGNTGVSHKAAGDELSQVWKASDGTTFAKKADAIAHNEALAKAAAEPTDLASALGALAAQVEKAEQSRPVDDLEKGSSFENVEGDEPIYFAKKDFSTDQRTKMAASGEAMKDGSFPIASKADLKNAVQAFGRAKDKVATKKHIIARAKSMGATDELPEGWDGSTKGGAKKYDGASLRKGLGFGSGRPSDAASLAKGLGTVGRLAELIQELEWLQQCQEWEEQAEGDDKSTLPQQLKEDVASLCSTLKDMVQEETSELFSDEEMDVYSELLECAHRPKSLDAVEKLLGTAPAALAKVGARHSKADMAKIQAMHDHATDLGACCKSDGASEKAAPAGELAKVTAERDTLQKQVTEALPVIADLAKRLKAIEDQPMPRPGSAQTEFRVVDKAADDAVAAQQQLGELAKNNPGAIAEALIRLSQQNPMKMQPGR